MCFGWGEHPLQHIALDTGFGIAGAVLEEAYQEDTECIGLIASKIVTNGRQIRMKMSTMHRWWEDFVHAWKAIPSLNKAIASG